MRIFLYIIGILLIGPFFNGKVEGGWYRGYLRDGVKGVTLEKRVGEVDRRKLFLLKPWEGELEIMYRDSEVRENRLLERAHRRNEKRVSDKDVEVERVEAGSDIPMVVIDPGSMVRDFMKRGGGIKVEKEKKIDGKQLTILLEKQLGNGKDSADVSFQMPYQGGETVIPSKAIFERR